MEVKINKEIRDYTESLFFGLSLRQLVFSVAAVAVALTIYLTLKNSLGIETLSWLCVVGSFPFAMLGFVKYHGLSAEELLWAFIKSELLTKRKLHYESDTLYRIMIRRKK